MDTESAATTAKPYSLWLTVRHRMGSLTNNVLAGLCLLLFLPRGIRLNTNLRQLLLALLLVLDADAALDWWWTASPTQFNADVIPSAVCAYLLLAVFGYACDRQRGWHGLCSWLPLAGLVTNLGLLGMEVLLWQSEKLWHGSWPDAFLNTLPWVFLAWWGLALFIGALRHLVRDQPTKQWAGKPWRRSLLLLLSLALVIGYKAHFANNTYWDSDAAADNGGPPPSPPADEALMYRQWPLLNQALNHLRPQRPGVPDLYFLGIAGDAAEPVFHREVQRVSLLMEQRFNTRGRSLLLVNHVDTNHELPLATQTSIQSALMRMGQLIDPREDIVFIYLSSHGSHDHHFVLDYDPLPIEWLNPEQLANDIRQAGIGYRVVVVSSCYSGGFIPALRDPKALVITAADADSSSFGCGDDTDFTWFGRAFFDQALRHQDSLVAAFNETRNTIAHWEQRDGYQPSHPQIWVGAQFERQWQNYLTQGRHTP